MNAQIQETPAQSTDSLRDRIADLMRRDGKLTQSVISKESGLSTSTVSLWFGGRYTGDNDKIEAQLAIWLESHLARETAATQLPAAPAYVATPTAERVIAALRYAQMAGDIATIYGGAGLGKTSAILEHARTAPNVWVCTMTPASSSVVTALEEICEQIGIRETTGGAARLYKAIVRRVMSSHGLIVIDEAQHLSVQALDQIRAIHDATNIGIALVGNETVYARMTGGNRAPFLDRLYSRIGKRVRLSTATGDDIAQLLDAWRIKDGTCKELLRSIAIQAGALRSLTKALRLAAMYARAAKRDVSCSDIKAAARELGLAGGT